MDALARILAPESIAVVGASADRSKRGYRAVADLQESAYEGAIYPVNPGREDPIRGLAVHPTVAAIPSPVDLALVVTPATVVPDVLEDCDEAGVAGAVVVSAGFGEASNADLQRRLTETVRDVDTRVVGPNSQGLLAVHDDVNLFDGYAIPTGGLAVLTQSGNVALEFAAEAIREGTAGFSYHVDVGNECDLTVDEFLAHLDADDRTDGVVVYAEGMADGRAFLQAAADVGTETPVVVRKGGQTDAGKRSAALHTASLAGRSDVAGGAYRQAGVHLVGRTDEVVPVAHALTTVPPAAGENVAVLTDGGGHATLSSDAVARSGLSLPDLGDETRRRLSELVPTSPNVTNPVDVMGQDDSPETFAECATVLLGDDAVDALLLTGRFGGHDRWGVDEAGADREPDVARHIGDLVDRFEKPVVAHSLGAGLDAPGVDALEAAGVPVSASLDVAVACLRALADRGRHLAAHDRTSDFHIPATSDEAHPLVETAIEAGRERLNEFASRRVLADDGLPVVPFELATSPTSAREAAERFDCPVVLKVVSDEVVHKTDAGGVALDVSPADAATAFERLLDRVGTNRPDAAVEGVLVSPMVDDAVELVAGVVTDAEFGPALMVGLGGVFVEVVEDVSFRALPVTEYDARAMLDELDGQAVLDGARGGTRVDRDAVVDFLVDLSSFVTSTPGVAELDVNPLFATTDGVRIADATLELSP
ncbi:MAG: acetate--CoA ligase family protein [Haloarculaceae archaeon]